MTGNRDHVSGLLRIVGSASGAAGASPVSLAGGAVEMWFDQAEPRTLTEIQADPDADGVLVAEALDPFFSGGWLRIADGLTEEPGPLWSPAGSPDVQPLHAGRLL